MALAARPGSISGELVGVADAGDTGAEDQPAANGTRQSVQRPLTPTFASTFPSWNLLAS